MKKYLLLTLALIGMAVEATAMSYEQARQQALFLTDKMAYELNLTEEQYEAAYEVNFDYLLGVNDPGELYGTYWERRNLDLSYILLDWQYNAYLAASYFYRPLYWNAGFWHFGIYARYPHRDYFYFGRPHFFDTYRGGHCWHNNGGRSWYHGRNFVNNDRGHAHDKDHHTGMRDGFRRGDFGNGERHFGSTGGGGRTPGATDRRQGGTNQGGAGRRGGITPGAGNDGNRQGTGSSTFGTRRSSTRSTAGASQSRDAKSGQQVRVGAGNGTSAGRRAGTTQPQSIGSSTRSTRTSRPQSFGNSTRRSTGSSSSPATSRRIGSHATPSAGSRPTKMNSHSGTGSRQSASPSTGSRSSRGGRR